MVWLLVALGVYVLILVGVTLLSLHPFRIPIFMSPGALGCSQEDVEFTTSDGVTLRGWWVEAPSRESLPAERRGPNAERFPSESLEPTAQSLEPSPSDLNAQRLTLNAPASSSPQPTPPSPHPTVAILSHGYMMNRSELSPLAPLFTNLGISCLIYDFRAHGRSGGKKSYLGYRERLDIEAAIALAKSRKPNAKIVLLGSSMGGAASALAAGENPNLVDALVLDSAYSKLSGAVIGWWRFLGGLPLSILLAPTTVIATPLAGFNPWTVDVSDALRKAGPIPVLFFHGDHDTLALPSESRKNQSACIGPIKVVWMERCGHSEGRWLQPELYNRELIEFLKEHVLERKS